MKVWSSQLWLRFKQLQLSPKNVFGASMGFEPMASALALQCSTNWAVKTHTLGAGQFLEFIVPWKEWNLWILCELRTYKWNEGVIIAVLWLWFKQLQLSLKNVFGALMKFEPMASALALQCSTNWAMKTHKLEAG